MLEPWERELDGWLRTVERIARIGGLTPRAAARALSRAMAFVQTEHAGSI